MHRSYRAHNGKLSILRMLPHGDSVSGVVIETPKYVDGCALASHIDSRLVTQVPIRSTSSRIRVLAECFRHCLRAPNCTLAHLYTQSCERWTMVRQCSLSNRMLYHSPLSSRHATADGDTVSPTCCPMHLPIAPTPAVCIYTSAASLGEFPSDECPP